MKRLQPVISSNSLTAVGPWLLLAAIATALPAQAQAQPTRPKTRGTIQDAEIEIVKDRVNTLPEATRNFEKIRLTPPPKPDRKVTYTYPDFRLPATRLNPAIQVLTIAQEQPEPLTGNYLKLGFGNYGTVYGRAHLHSTRNEQYSYGLDVRHQSSASGPVDDKNSAVSQTSVAATGEYYKEAITFGAALDYARDRYHYYGYQETIVPPQEENIRQTFNRFGVRAYARNRAPDAPLHYEVGVGYKYLKDDFAQASESNFLLDGKVGYDLNETSRVTLEAQGSFISDTEPATFGGLTSNLVRTRNFGQATPAYELTTKTGLSLTLGATLGYSSEPLRMGENLNGVDKASINPAVRVAYAVVPEKFQVYAGLGGAIQRVTRYDLSQENPWLTHTIGLGIGQRIADTHYGPTGYAGFTAAPAGGLELAARATYGRTRNLYFYNIQSDPARFGLAYDSAAVNVLTLHTELAYNVSDKWRAGLKADYNHYGVQALAHPYGRPAFVSTLYGTYQATDKLTLGADFYFTSPNYATDYYQGLDRQTNAVIDLNLRGDYRITPKFSIFALANNLANRKYQPYLNYPVKGFNGILGLTYSF
ncbi:MAG: hypothetical protein ACRYFX_25210 [Janthinobacterium lividum]